MWVGDRKRLQGGARPQMRRSRRVVVSGSQTYSVLLAVFLNVYIVINILELGDFTLKKSVLLDSPENPKT